MKMYNSAQMNDLYMQEQNKKTSNFMYVILHGKFIKKINDSRSRTFEDHKQFYFADSESSMRVYEDVCKLLPIMHKQAIENGNDFIPSKITLETGKGILEQATIQPNGLLAHKM